MMTIEKNNMSAPDHNAEGRNQQDADHLMLFLDAARDSPPEMSTLLRERILTDAMASRTAPARPTVNALGWRNWFSGWAAPGFAGGVTVAVLGFWIGVTMPMPVMALDAPEWLQGALGYLDLMAVQLIGIDDPLLMEF